MKKVILLFSFLFIAIFIINIWLASSRSDKSNQTYQAIKNSSFECPEGLTEKIERWGENGYSRSCADSQNSKWEAWERGYKNIDGEYVNGRKNGKWIWFHPSGKIYREIYYDQGTEVSNNIINAEP